MAEIIPSRHQGHWTLITGGSSGIGLGCAMHLAQEGSSLILLDRDEIALQTARASLESIGAKVITVAADVRDTDKLEQFAAQLDQDQIRVQHLVTAAGILQPMEEIGRLSRETHDAVWDINYHGTYHACRIWGERMRGAGSGSIVTISSITAFRGTPLLAYGPAKAALCALTASLAVSAARDGVRVNSVAPGFTMTAALDEKVRTGQRDASSILAHIPMKRFAETEEVATAISYLLSDAASAITGITLPVDCGWLAGSAWKTFHPATLHSGGDNVL